MHVASTMWGTATERTCSPRLLRSIRPASSTKWFSRVALFTINSVGPSCSRPGEWGQCLISWRPRDWVVALFPRGVSDASPWRPGGEQATTGSGVPPASTHRLERGASRFPPPISSSCVGGTPQRSGRGSGAQLRSSSRRAAWRLFRPVRRRQPFDRCEGRTFFAPVVWLLLLLAVGLPIVWLLRRGLHTHLLSAWAAVAWIALVRWFLTRF